MLFRVAQLPIELLFLCYLLQRARRVGLARATQMDQSFAGFEIVGLAALGAAASEFISWLLIYRKQEYQRLSASIEKAVRRRTRPQPTLGSQPVQHTGGPLARHTPAVLLRLARCASCTVKTAGEGEGGAGQGREE